MKIGVGQINTVVGDLSSNRAKIIEYAERGERLGLDLIVFPELAITGYPILDLAYRKSFARAAQKEIERIVEWSANRHISLAVGTLEKNDFSDKKGYNSLFFIQRGKILARQRKSLLPTYDVFIEEMFFKKGTESSCISISGIRIGGTICEDIWDEGYKHKPLKELQKKGAQLIINASASPFHAGRAKEREALIANHARQYRVPFVFANLVGGQDDLIFDGRSLIVNEKGEVLRCGASFKEDLIWVEWGNKDTEAPSISVEREPRTEEIYQALCLGLKDYVRKNGFTKVVVGLSGGVDSSLVATIARDALGPENVIGVAMPGPYSSQASWEDAEILAQNLNIEFRVRSIRKRFRAQKAELKKMRIRETFFQGKGCLAKWVGNMVSLIPSSFLANHGSGLADENLQARLRGELLMYLSNAEGCLVLSTGNKSELAVGYCTLYGDMCGGLSVLADVYKTQVWKLASFRNQRDVVIPERVITKPPSAELRPNQTDQDSLPPYELLDTILNAYIEEDRDPEEIIAVLKKQCGDILKQRDPSELVSQIAQRVDQNEYKRRQGAPALRVSPKAWYGRRMPIVNKFGMVPGTGGTP